MKRATKVLLADRFHKGFVWTCMTATVLGTVSVLTNAFDIFYTRKPLYDEMQKKEVASLLEEGRDNLEELKDSAPSTSG